MFMPKIGLHGLHCLRFTSGDGLESVDFDRFWSGGQILTRDDVVLEGEFDLPDTGEVSLRHRFGDRVLAEVGVQRGDGVFRFPVRLMRGHNRLEIEHRDGRNPSLSLSVFHRTSLRDWLDNIVKTLILLKLIQSFVVQTFFIPSGSMENTFYPGDYILVEKLSGLFRPQTRGDIVIFEFPQDRRKDFVKRLVALEGDTVAVERGVLSLGGRPVRDDDFAVHKDIGEGESRAWRIWSCDMAPTRVPRGHVFVMGDNREHSYDSRGWGPLSRHRLKGRAFAIYWPFARCGLVRGADLAGRLGGAP